MRIVFAATALGALLAGCADPNEAVFVTKTSVGIEFASTPATASIGYDRKEGYIGPRYANGAIPPVVGVFRSDGGIFNPEVAQVYATGDAAKIATDEDATSEDKPLKGEKEVVFFGTTTELGLAVSGTSGAPDSLTFGFKRREISIIPLGTDPETGEDKYPSVLASIDTTTKAAGADQAGLENVQFFATGRAADNLAGDDSIRGFFKDEAKSAIAQYNVNRLDQAVSMSSLFECLGRVDPAHYPRIYKHAARQQLISVEEYRAIDTAAAAGVDKGKAQYGRTLVGVIDANKQEQTGQLNNHKALVCGLT